MTASGMDYGDDPGWSSILGLPIPLRRIRLHFWSFSVAVTALTAFNITARVAAHIEASRELPWHQIPPLLTADIIPTVIFCGIFSPIGVEATTMVIAAYYSRRKRRENLEKGRAEGRAKGRAEGLAEGRAEGIEEANAAWREWNLRRLVAEDTAQPFDEPPPSFDSGAEDTGN